MTDEATVQPVIVVDDHDWLLESLIEKYVGIGVGMGITLNVKGLLVTGTLCTSQEYLKGVSELIGAANKDDELTQAMAGAFGAYTAVYEKPEGAGEDWVPPRIGYVHLKNAKILTPGQKAMPNDPIWWRGRLSSIDGFFIGTLS